MERAILYRCYTSTFVSSVTNASVFSLISYSFIRQLIPNRRIAAAASVLPVCILTAISWDPGTSCYLGVARQLDSPLGADVRTVLRGKFPGNGITTAIDAKERDRAEKDQRSGTGLPLLWELPGAGSSSAAGRRGSEQQSLESQSEADVMVITEDEMSEAGERFGSMLPTSQRTLQRSVASALPQPPLLSSSSTPSLSFPPLAATSHTSAPPPPPRSRQPPSAAAQIDSDDNPFAVLDPSSRATSAAKVAEEERRRRRDERERVRQQHDDEKRQRMVQRGREEGRMTGAATAVGGGGCGEVKRRFVRRNEFGDEVYEDDDMK